MDILAFFAIVALMVLMVACAIVILRIVDRFTVGRPTSKEVAAEHERKFQQRLLNPQWPELEQYFGFKIPAALRSLYSDRERLERKCFYVVPPDAKDENDHAFIARFEPADAQSLKDTWLPIEESRFPFASDDYGNYFYVELASDRDDPPVYFADHDGGIIDLIAESLSEFLRWEIYVDDARCAD